MKKKKKILFMYVGQPTTLVRKQIQGNKKIVQRLASSPKGEKGSSFLRLLNKTKKS